MQERNNRKPKILVFDIETSPVNVDIWALGQQYIAADQIRKDWSILSFAAKWFGEKKIYYYDTRNEDDVRNDKKVVAALWNLLDKTDILIAHNGDKFDIKKFNYRAALHGLKPPSHYRSTDTYKETRKVFGATSNKLSYYTEQFNKKYKKLKHNKYPGRELWTEVLKGNKDAWNHMKKYNIHDVLSTEEFLVHITPWIKMHNLSSMFDDLNLRCLCGSKKLIKKGYVYTDTGKYQGYKCKECGRRPRSRTNLLNAEQKRGTLR